jgi:hypothetical protein
MPQLRLDVETIIAFQYDDSLIDVLLAQKFNRKCLSIFKILILNKIPCRVTADGYRESVLCGML